MEKVSGRVASPVRAMAVVLCIKIFLELLAASVMGFYLENCI